jgi:hypothetical protein
MSAAAWEKKSKEQQQQHMERFLTFPVLKKANIAISTDGKMGVLVPTHGGKKINQVKRKRTAKTTTKKMQKVNRD